MALADNEPHASILQAALAAEGIQSMSEPIWVEGFGSPTGRVKVLVLEQDAERARKRLGESALKQRAKISSEERP